MKVQLSFIFPRAKDREQHLFLSDDYKRLLDIRDEEASIYKLKYVEGEPTFKRAVFVSEVKKLPFDAYDNDANQLLFMFSPDFLLHIDIDPVKKNWIVRDSIKGTITYRIPQTFLSYNPKEKNEVFE